ncbi:MAG: hypothetical protein ACI9JL_002918 [Paracoccaceae bacterium]
MSALVRVLSIYNIGGMTVHLIKLAVGIESLSHLSERQTARLAAAAATGETAVLRHLTRSTPRRSDEVLDGGSIYWVIKGAVRARQRIVDIDTAINHKGLPRCALIFDRELVPLRARPHRAFQGWRYLDPADAPVDAIGGLDQSDDMPVEMAEELRALGLL